ncbi:MAG TPA: LptF/LptG family permease, partial [Rhizobiales bacterium]|nr:LptF/LptG family permease [Hyphomicrobiales bacterium]
QLPVLRLSDGLVIRVKPPKKGEKAKPAEVTFYDRVDSLLGKERGPVRRARGKDQRELTLFELWQRMDSPPPKTTRAELTAELNDRIMRILIIPILPILAIPFAMSRRRGYRSYRFATAAVLLVVFNELLQNGKRAVALGNMSPLIGQWLPITLFAAFSIWSFYRTAFTIAAPRLDPVWERLHEPAKLFLNKLVKRLGFAR